MEFAEHHREAALAPSDTFCLLPITAFIFKLPDEILNHILEYVYELSRLTQPYDTCSDAKDWIEKSIVRIHQTHRAFAPIMRTCKRFCRIATAHLCRNFVFDENELSESCRNLRYQTMLKHPSLLKFTRKLILRNRGSHLTWNSKTSIESVASQLLNTHELVLDLRCIAFTPSTTMNLITVAASAMHSLTTLDLYFGQGAGSAVKSRRIFRTLRKTSAKHSLKRLTWHDVFLAEPHFDESILKELDGMSVRTLHIIFNTQQFIELSVSSLRPHWPERLEKLTLSLPLTACWDYPQMKSFDSVEFCSPTVAAALPAEHYHYSLCKACYMLPLDLEILTITVPSEPDTTTDEDALIESLSGLITSGTLVELHWKISGIDMDVFGVLFKTLENWWQGIAKAIENVHQENRTSSLRRMHVSIPRGCRAWYHLLSAPEDELESIHAKFEELAQVFLERSVKFTWSGPPSIESE